MLKSFHSLNLHSLHPLFSAFNDLSMLPSLFLHAKNRFRITSLYGASDALFLAEQARNKEAQQCIIVFTEEARHAQRLYEELSVFATNLRILIFPDWETLPYDHFSPHQDLISERLATLYHLLHQNCDIVLIPVTTALTRLPPPQFIQAHTFFVHHKQKMDLNALCHQCIQAGYESVKQVLRAGEFSRRGSIFDIFPMGSTVPYRLDFFDNEIENIRIFDVETQRSLKVIESVRVLPAREIPLDDTGILRFKERFQQFFEIDIHRCELARQVSHKLAPSGIEYYLPLFFDNLATIFDYLHANSLIILHHCPQKSIQQFWQETKSRYTLFRGDHLRPVLPPETLFINETEFFTYLKQYKRFDIIQADQSENHSEKAFFCPIKPFPVFHHEKKQENPFIYLKKFIHDFHAKVLFCVHTLGRREILSSTLHEYKIQFYLLESFEDFLKKEYGFYLLVAPIEQGFIFEEDSKKWALLTEGELFARALPRQKSQASSKQRRVTDQILRDLSEVKIHDPVVHENYGIGRYLGLCTLDLGEGESEFLALEYHGEDRLYVPVAHLHLISRYSGHHENVSLHRLGANTWDKTKRKALEKARDTAAELLNLYAKRALRKGYHFQIDWKEYETFAEDFGFEETPDQAQAIQAVIEDMTSDKPMDRLICGDVGFGKTEVALRAAFIALMDGKQVVLLVPTTLLAEQHYQNFSARFANYPVKIAEISRFKTKKEQTLVLKGVEEGSIDLIIGTHRLLQKDVLFKNLGLVIIDEEHRFGVRQKEQLKQLRTSVDILALTATPIPRSLSLSLEGMRDFSVIATAPQRRLAIKTFVTRFDHGIIREAIIRELRRGGQIYFLHNEIDTIHTIQEKLQTLVPEARVQIAHGQMPERELEHVMRDFYQQRFNLLLCTTIIETGIDVPTANTILINRADRFGLAQLHQLRGRVGRSHHQAYAYLLTPIEKESMNKQAQQRLEAIQNLDELGAGFYLALHDLEIRGAGEILGDAQSGEIHEVGFSLYTEMLNQAIKTLSQENNPDGQQQNENNGLHLVTEINLHTPALLPASYCDDVNERLTLYKRLANCEQLDQLDSLHQELIDRFGIPPESTQNLIEIHRLRILSQQLGIKELDANHKHIVIRFCKNPPIDTLKLIQLVQKDPTTFKFIGNEILKIDKAFSTVAERIKQIKEFIHFVNKKN